MIVVGICGEPLSGKTMYTNTLVEKLGLDKCTYLNLDNYKINNLFVPESYDYIKFISDINNSLKPIVILEGHFIFCNRSLMETMTIKIYIDTIDTIDTINISPFTTSISNYIIPSKSNADIIVYANNNSIKSIELLVGFINNKL